MSKKKIFEGEYDIKVISTGEDFPSFNLSENQLENLLVFFIRKLI